MDVTFSKIMSLVGIAVFISICFALSNNRGAIQRRVVGWGLGLQVIFAVLILGIPMIGLPGVLQPLFSLVTDFFNALLTFTQAGTSFLFGSFTGDEHGFVFALAALPTIVFLSSLLGVLYHLGIMQKVVKGFAWIMYKTMRVSGAESLSAAANVFVGQTEAPLLVRPFVQKMTNSELFCLMVGGMTTVAGSVLAVYVAMLAGFIPDIAGHLLTASVLSAPAAIMISKIMIPETETPESAEGVPAEMSEKIDSNVIEAAARGATDGMHLAFNVGAMLLAFIALIFMVDSILTMVGGWVGFGTWGASMVADPLLQDGQANLTLAVIFSWLFAPVAFLMGVPWSETGAAGALLGEKIAINEFVAYLHLSQIGGELSERTVIILSYALCGFANFSSIAIQVGGIGAMAPDRRGDLAKLGIRSIVGGTLAAFITACIANVFI
ncbi:MAG: nucleoside transporter C-terminal domain-containing protein [Sulfitobacter sp.]